MRGDLRLASGRGRREYLTQASLQVLLSRELWIRGSCWGAGMCDFGRAAVQLYYSANTVAGLGQKAELEFFELLFLVGL